jgi:hypothetical protein
MDDYSRFITIFLLKQKSEVYGAFKEYDKRFHNVNGRHVTTLRSDGRSNPTGTEYHNSDMNQYCKEFGMSQVPNSKLFSHLALSTFDQKRG